MGRFPAEPSHGALAAGLKYLSGPVNADRGRRSTALADRRRWHPVRVWGPVRYLGLDVDLAVVACIGAHLSQDPGWRAEHVGRA